MIPTTRMVTPQAADIDHVRRSLRQAGPCGLPWGRLCQDRWHVGRAMRVYAALLELEAWGECECVLAADGPRYRVAVPKTDEDTPEVITR